MLKIVENQEEESILLRSLDDIARAGAQRMLAQALEAEIASHLEAHASVCTQTGTRAVVRNGYGRSRKVSCGAGSLEVRVPRARDLRSVADEKLRFVSRIVPPWMRRSPQVSELLPLLYLRGLSTGDFRPVLGELLGAEGRGLSETNIARLTEQWKGEYDAFQKRDLLCKRYVYVWADGIHFNVRLEDDRLCTLVVLGVTEDGTKELVALEDGYRESTESWQTLLQGLKKRGLVAPALAVGDGALGFWTALRDVWPETQEQRDWCHKMGNVLDKLPKRLQPQAKSALRDIMYADTKEDAEADIKAFVERYGTKHPKAAECLTKDQDKLLTCFSFPAEHWKHIRTSNPIESTFATVRLRQRVTKGAGSRNKALLMAYKLIDMASKRWRKISAPALLARVLRGERCKDGAFQTQEPTTDDAKIAA